MSDPFVGEIKLFGGNFAPLNWAFCDGSLLSIAQNSALFALLGTTYGGNGTSTFALPDLRGRVPIHRGQGAGLSNRILGESGGSETIILNASQLPIHTHPLQCSSSPGDSRSPSGAYPALDATAAAALYSNGAADATMNGTLCQPTGGGQAHENRMPYLAINYIISLFGIFPSQ